jgi:hypothetical protein
MRRNVLGTVAPRLRLAPHAGDAAEADMKESAFR